MVITNPGRCVTIPINLRLCPATDWRPPGLCVEAQQTRWPQATLNDLSLLHAGNINIICYIYIRIYSIWYIYIYIHDNHDYIYIYVRIMKYVYIYNYIYVRESLYIYIHIHIFNVMYTLCFWAMPDPFPQKKSRLLEPCTGGWFSCSLEAWNDGWRGEFSLQIDIS